MAMNINAEKSIKVTCPFFIRYGQTGNRFTILCEGTYKGATHRMTFDSKEVRNRFAAKHCENAGLNCKQCKVLSALYEQKESGG